MSSLFLFIAQVFYVEQIAVFENHRQKNKVHEERIVPRVFNIEVALVLFVIPAVLFPVLVTMVSTEFLDVTNANEDSKRTLYVFIALTGLSVDLLVQN